MNNNSNVLDMISWLFGILFFAIGVVNTFWGTRLECRKIEETARRITDGSSGLTHALPSLNLETKAGRRLISYLSSRAIDILKLRMKTPKPVFSLLAEGVC